MRNKLAPEPANRLRAVFFCPSQYAPYWLIHAQERKERPRPKLKLGEVCAGYGGLGLAVEEALNAEITRYSEFEAAPSKSREAHWHEIPNHGDMTQIDRATRIGAGHERAGRVSAKRNKLGQCENAQVSKSGPQPVNNTIS